MIFQKSKECTDCSLRCIWTTKQNASRIFYFHSLTHISSYPARTLSNSSLSLLSELQWEARLPAGSADSLRGGPTWPEVQENLFSSSLLRPCSDLLGDIPWSISFLQWVVFQGHRRVTTGGKGSPTVSGCSLGPWCRYEDTGQRPPTQSPALATLQPPPVETWVPHPTKASHQHQRCRSLVLQLPLYNLGLCLLITCCPTALQRWPLSGPAPADRLLLSQSCELLYCPW